MYKLIIFDLNGTLTNTPFIDKKPLALLPGRLEKCQELLAQNITLAIASNQGGVAFGYLSESEAEQEVAGIAVQIGTLSYAVAYGHQNPRPGYERYKSAFHLFRRKPGPGMLLELMLTACIGPKDTLFVGDLPEDQGAAEAAGVAFMKAEEFFKEAQ